MHEIYAWIDKIPLSRVKKNIARDFSDGVLMSEVMHHYFPKLVDLHNYIKTNSVSKKTYNWNTMNKKVFKKLGIQVDADEIHAVSTGKKGAIEKLLMRLKPEIEECYEKKPQERKKSASKRRSFPPSTRTRATAGTRARRTTTVRAARPQQFRQAENLLIEKDSVIEDLRETVAILQMKVQKLEQLLRLKDTKIEQLVQGKARNYGSEGY